MQKGGSVKKGGTVTRVTRSSEGKGNRATRVAELIRSEKRGDEVDAIDQTKPITSVREAGHVYLTEAQSKAYNVDPYSPIDRDQILVKVDKVSYQHKAASCIDRDDWSRGTNVASKVDEVIGVHHSANWTIPDTYVDVVKQDRYSDVRGVFRKINSASITFENVFDQEISVFISCPKTDQVKPLKVCHRDKEQEIVLKPREKRSLTVGYSGKLGNFPVKFQNADIPEYQLFHYAIVIPKMNKYTGSTDISNSSLNKLQVVDVCLSVNYQVETRHTMGMQVEHRAEFVIRDLGSVYGLFSIYREPIEKLDGLTLGPTASGKVAVASVNVTNIRFLSGAVDLPADLALAVIMLKDVSNDVSVLVRMNDVVEIPGAVILDKGNYDGPEPGHSQRASNLFMRVGVKLKGDTVSQDALVAVSGIPDYSANTAEMLKYLIKATGTATAGLVPITFVDQFTPCTLYRPNGLSESTVGVDAPYGSILGTVLIVLKAATKVVEVLQKFF